MPSFYEKRPMAAVLVDAGPLVAVLDRSDPQHAVCIRTLQTIRDPLVTVWPAMTEAMYLLRSFWPAQAALCEMVETEAVRLLTLERTDVPRIKELIRKYRDLPMDLADAALVYFYHRAEGF